MPQKKYSVSIETSRDDKTFKLGSNLVSPVLWPKVCGKETLLKEPCERFERAHFLDEVAQSANDLSHASTANEPFF